MTTKKSTKSKKNRVNPKVKGRVKGRVKLRDQRSEVRDKIKNMSVHFVTGETERETPQEFFDQINNDLGPFDLDVCATIENAKCARFFTKKDDGLSQTWAPAKVWMNPPYGREIGPWMRKAYEEAQRGALVVCLVPSRTDNNWWHGYAMKGQICFIKGRLRFGGAGGGPAPFPTALIVYLPGATERGLITPRLAKDGREI